MSNVDIPLVEMRHITKAFSTVVANDDVSITLYEGEILAIVGENGAGKTTLMRILYGLEKPDKGDILFKGHTAHLKGPLDAIQLGIGMLQQHFMLFDSMTVAENVTYNNEKHRSIFIDKEQNNRLVAELSKRYGLPVDPTLTIAQCSVGTQQKVEILKILYQNADIIIFDEPSAVLTPLEVEELLETIRNLCQIGKSIILITHKLNEVMAISDRVVVMRDGRVVAESKTQDIDLETLSFHVVNRELKHFKISAHPPGRPLLEIKDLFLKNNKGKQILSHVSLNVKSGEIIGLAGVSGNGQTELAHCVAGLTPYDKGRILINGHLNPPGSVRQSRDAGLSHIPDDRYLWGSAGEANLAENILMGDEGDSRFSQKGVLNLKRVRQYSLNILKKYKVKIGSVQQRFKELSGGNAQKLIAAREISKDTPVILAHEPTRGIDIGATEFIHERLIEKRNEDGCVLLISSDLSEIMKLSDRIYVIFEGKINGEFKRGLIDEKSLGILMLGGQLKGNAKANAE